MKKTNIINGDVTFNPKDDYSDVEEITGSLSCQGADTRAAFPKLSTVGGSLDCRGADTRAAFPKLSTVGGFLNYQGADTRAAFPKLSTVGGGLYCHGADTRAAFPKLSTVGGSLDCQGADTRAAFPKLKNKEAGNSGARVAVARAFRRKGFLFADGLLSRIVETKQSRGGAQIHRIVAVGKNKTSYCIELDGTYSHGNTIKEARESLIYKIGERDKSAYVGWKLDRKISAKEAIESYRVITGACEAGVRGFVQSHGKLKRTYNVQEVIDLTKGQYGNDAYAAFFSERAALAEEQK